MRLYSWSPCAPARKGAVLLSAQRPTTGRDLELRWFLRVDETSCRGSCTLESVVESLRRPCSSIRWKDRSCESRRVWKRTEMTSQKAYHSPLSSGRRLHGMLSSHRTWSAVVDGLRREGWATYAPDLLGFGTSPWPRGADSPDSRRIHHSRRLWKARTTRECEHSRHHARRRSLSDLSGAPQVHDGGARAASGERRSGGAGARGTPRRPRRRSRLRRLCSQKRVENADTAQRKVANRRALGDWARLSSRTIDGVRLSSHTIDGIRLSIQNTIDGVRLSSHTWFDGVVKRTTLVRLTRRGSPPTRRRVGASKSRPVPVRFKHDIGGVVEGRETRARIRVGHHRARDRIVSNIGRNFDGFQKRSRRLTAGFSMGAALAVELCVLSTGTFLTQSRDHSRRESRDLGPDVCARSTVSACPAALCKARSIFPNRTTLETRPLWISRVLENEWHIASTVGRGPQVELCARHVSRRVRLWRSLSLPRHTPRGMHGAALSLRDSRELCSMYEKSFARVHTHCAQMASQRAFVLPAASLTTIALPYYSSAEEARRGVAGGSGWRF